jgi:two-component sensor histidine kinase
VADNGAGMPESLDIRNTKSLELHLVTSLAEHQLQGKLELDRTNGTEFRISFRESTHRRM